MTRKIPNTITLPRFRSSPLPLFLPLAKLCPTSRDESRRVIPCVC